VDGEKHVTSQIDRSFCAEEADYNYSASREERKKRRKKKQQLRRGVQRYRFVPPVERKKVVFGLGLS